jgi:hypothetical protein
MTSQTTSVQSDQEIRDQAGYLLAHGESKRAIAMFRDVFERNSKELSFHLWEYRTAIMTARAWDELDALADRLDFSIFDPMRRDRLHDLTQLERRIFLEVCLEACQSPEALAQLSRAVRYVIECNIPGDFVECGVFKGASIVCVIRTLQALSVDDRTIWLYDTFEGMSKPEAIDVFWKQTPEHDGGLKSWEILKRPDGGSNWVRSPIEEVREIVGRTDYPAERCVFVKGLVEDTIPAQAPERICLLRLDTDFYRSTKHELVHLYPRLAPAGVLLLDDYGAYRGAQVATDEYFNEIGARPLLSRIDEHVRMLVKP